MRVVIANVLILILLSACSTQQPIYNVSASPVPQRSNGTKLSIEEVRGAIFAATTIKGWKPTSVNANEIQAKITVRDRHTATIDIKYTDSSYSINLSSSGGLDEKDGNIHRNYNKWIILLDTQIQAELLEKATG